jgi:hypothetical protein
MPPRTFRDLTEEEIEELERDLAPRAAVPRLPVGAMASTAGAAPWQVSLGSARFLDDPAPYLDIEAGGLDILGDAGAGDPEKDAWLDELIGRPEPAPPRPMLSAAGSGGTFTGQDTPEARELIKQRGMQVTAQPPPSDDDLLEALTSQRPATMPELGGDDGWLDELIGQQGAAMDREQPAASAASAPLAAPAQRRSREDELIELLAPPTRMQGIAAAIGDAFFGGERTAQVQGRQRGYEQALAQARMQDVAAGERSDERAADREMMDARMGITMRGQDLANERGIENRDLRRQLAEQSDRRLRELETQREGAALERTAKSRADAGAPTSTPEELSAGVAGLLAQQANVSRDAAVAFVAGRTEGIPPEELERLQVTHDQWKIMSPKKQQEVLAAGLRREGATPDSIAAANEKKRADPKVRLELKTGIDEVGRDIARAARAWAKMSPQARKAFVSLVPEGNFESAIRQGLMTPEEQRYASDVQALANGLVKQRAGSAVTGSEWKRVAGEIGFPMNDWAVFNSPEVIGHWIDRAKQGWVGRVKNTRSEYGDLWGSDGGP